MPVVYELSQYGNWLSFFSQSFSIHEQEVQEAHMNNSRRLRSIESLESRNLMTGDVLAHVTDAGEVVLSCESEAYTSLYSPCVAVEAMELIVAEGAVDEHGEPAKLDLLDGAHWFDLQIRTDPNHWVLGGLPAPAQDANAGQIRAIVLSDRTGSSQQVLSFSGRAEDLTIAIGVRPENDSDPAVEMSIDVVQTPVTKDDFGLTFKANLADPNNDDFFTGPVMRCDAVAGCYLHGVDMISKYGAIRENSEPRIAAHGEAITLAATDERYTIGWLGDNHHYIPSGDEFALSNYQGWAGDLSLSWGAFGSEYNMAIPVDPDESWGAWNRGRDTLRRRIGDIDGDGQVNFTDFLILQNNFGQPGYGFDYFLAFQTQFGLRAPVEMPTWSWVC